MASLEKMATWKGHASVKGSTETMRMILLSFSAIGITFTWGFEMTYCTPYLLNLGLTKSSTSLVWIAGPISGLIVQPIVGAIADQSTAPWGRRRPLMVIGSLIAAAHVLLLGFTREFVGLFLAESDFSSRLTVWLAVYSIWVIDFAINASMSCSRSLVVDVLPINKQQAGSAWYSRLAACGHLLAYSAGSLDLVGIFGSRAGDSQFKQLALVAVFAMLSTCALTCWAVTEKVLVSRKGDGDGENDGDGGVSAALKTLWATLRHLPPRVKAICWAHFWAWIGPSVSVALTEIL
jgi:solute carrier family 45 protein 1/2/4